MAVSSSLLVLILKIAPLAFSVVLRVTEVGFYSRWDSLWNRYKGEEDLSYGDEGHEFRFRCVSLYAYDKMNMESSVESSLVYLSLLHILLVVQEGVTLLLLPAVIFFLFSLSVRRVSEAFFMMKSDRRNPTRYEKYYYDSESGTGENDKKYYKRWFFTENIDRFLSPPRVSIVIKLLIILNIAGLEVLLRIFPNRVRSVQSVLDPQPASVLMSIFVAGSVCVFALLLFPSRNSWFKTKYDRLRGFL